MAKRPDELDPAWIAHKERNARPRMGDTAFTEVFLSRFDKEDAWTVRRFGQLVETTTMESESVGAHPYPMRESYARHDLRAILADLRRLEHELAWVERNNKDQPEELKLCRLATRKAFAVARIADAIEQAIGPAPEAAEHPDQD